MPSYHLNGSGLVLWNGEFVLMASSPVCASEVGHPALLEVLVALTGVLFGVHLVAVSDVGKNQQRYFEHASEQVSSRDEEVQVLLVVPWEKNTVRFQLTRLTLPVKLQRLREHFMAAPEEIATAQTVSGVERLRWDSILTCWFWHPLETC